MRFKLYRALICVFFPLTIFTFSQRAEAYETKRSPVPQIRIQLKDGNILVGPLLGEDQKSYRIYLINGEVEVSKSAVAQIEIITDTTKTSTKASAATPRPKLSLSVTDSSSTSPPAASLPANKFGKQRPGTGLMISGFSLTAVGGILVGLGLGVQSLQAERNSRPDGAMEAITAIGATVGGSGLLMGIIGGAIFAGSEDPAPLSLSPRFNSDGGSLVLSGNF